MANFIKIQSKGTDINNIGSYLINASSVLTVLQMNQTTTDIYLEENADEAEKTKIVITHTATGTGKASMKDAINNALTASPGGNPSHVDLPAGISVTNIAFVTT